MKQALTGFSLLGIAFFWGSASSPTEASAPLDIQQSPISIEKADQLRGGRYARPGVSAFKQVKRVPREPVSLNRRKGRLFSEGLKFKNRAQKIRTKAEPQRNFRHQKFYRRVRY